MGRRGDGSTLTRVRSVSRAFAILRSFRKGEPEVSLKDLASRAELDNATTRRLLATLGDEGLVNYNPITSRYGLTTGLLLLANAVNTELTLKEIAHESLAKLANQTSTNVFLSAHKDGKMVCLDKHNRGAQVDIKWWEVDESLPFNCGAAPKLILAYMSTEEIKQYLDNGHFEQLTPHSVTDPKQLKEQLKEARSQGWLLSLDDVSNGLSALAAPILNNDGELIASVSIGGLTPQIADGSPPKLLDDVLSCTKEIQDKIIAAGGQVQIF